MIGLAAALLVLYGNAVNLLLRPPLPGASNANVALGLGLSALGLVAARRARFSRADVGIGRWRIGSALGLASAAALGLPAVAAISRPPLFGGPIGYTPARTVPAATLAKHLIVSLPLGVALPEELLFRGVLLAALRRTIGARAAVAVTSALFALWHVTSVARTLSETEFGPVPRSRAIPAAGAAAALLAGGAVFAALREASGSLVAPILAHWGFNAAVLLRLRI